VALFFLFPGDEVHFTFSSPVPEPSTFLLLVSGLIGGATAFNRRQRWSPAGG
jgi:hypothetical protein